MSNAHEGDSGPFVALYEFLAEVIRDRETFGKRLDDEGRDAEF